jgi:hypothetical protein
MKNQTKSVMLTAGLLIAGLLIGGFGVWFLIPQINSMLVNADAKTAAKRVQVNVTENNYSFSMSPDAGAKVIFWQSGGYALSLTDQWMECAWQLDVGQEDKPKNGQGDFLDVILKITRWKDGGTSYAVLCGGQYTKTVYFDGVKKLDTSIGTRYAEWSV